MQTAKEIDRVLAKWQVRRTIARIKRDRPALLEARARVKALISQHMAAVRAEG